MLIDYCETHQLGILVCADHINSLDGDIDAIKTNTRSFLGWLINKRSKS